MGKGFRIEGFSSQYFKEVALLSSRLDCFLLEIYHHLVLPDIMCPLSLVAFKIFFLPCFKWFDYVCFGISSCLLYFGLLGFLDLWVEGVYQLWQIFSHYFFGFFFPVPSSVLWGLQLCLNLAAWSCPTVHWCFVSFILFSGFHLGEFLLVYFQIHYFFSAALQFLSLEVWLEPLDFRCLYSTCSVFPLVPWVHGIIIPVFMCPSTNSIVCHFWIHFHWFVSSLQVIFRSTLCTW